MKGYSISHHALERWRQRVDASADASDVKRAVADAVQIPRDLSPYFNECRPNVHVMWSEINGVLIVAGGGKNGGVIVTCYPPRKGQIRLLVRLGVMGGDSDLG